MIASSAPEDDEDVAQALITILGWAEAFWRAAFIGVLVLAAVIVVDVLLNRRLALARDLLLAGLLVVGPAVVLGRVVDVRLAPARGTFLSQWGSPSSASRPRLP